MCQWHRTVWTGQLWIWSGLKLTAILGPAAPSRLWAQVALVKQIERSQKEYAEGRRQRDKEILQLRRKVRPAAKRHGPASFDLDVMGLSRRSTHIPCRRICDTRNKVLA